jgi:DNA end-binding protein Ku
MIHEPSGQPIRYLKGISTDEGFEEVSEDAIIKGYEHSKGQHVLLRPEEIDDLKLEAKHTIDMVRFVDAVEIDSRYWEKPYYLTPDGDDADEGYTVIREALKQTKKIAIGQMVMGGRGYLVGIKAHGKGLMLSILRYAQELRDEAPYFDRVTGEADPEAVALAVELINKQSGKFEPKAMPDQFTAAVKAYLRAKVEQRAPEVTIAKEGAPAPQVINIMDALKKSIQAKGRTKVRNAVPKRMGKEVQSEQWPYRASAGQAHGERRIEIHVRRVLH